MRAVTAITVALTLALMAALGLAVAGPAQAGSSKDTAEGACAAALKQEFGAARVSYRRFRKGNERTMVEATLEMTDGSTRRILCEVRGETVSRVRFDGAGGWTEQRPPNAGYIETEEEKAARAAAEKAEADAAEAAAAEAAEREKAVEAARGVRKRVGGAAPEPKAPEAAAPEPAPPAPPGPEAGAADAGDAAEAGAAEDGKDGEAPARAGPRFLKPPDG